MKVLAEQPTVPNYSGLTVLDRGLSATITTAAHEIEELDRLLRLSGAMLPTMMMLGEELRMLVWVQWQPKSLTSPRPELK